MYDPLSEGVKAKLGNNGFTLYGLLSDSLELESRRFYWQRDLETYDLIVVADIWENWAIFWNLFKKYPHKRFVIVDGHDIPAIYPYNNMTYRVKKMPVSFLAPVRKVKYFKREIWGGAACYGMEHYLPPFFTQRFKIPDTVYPISMSIPEEKIKMISPEEKSKDFVDYLIDKELAHLLQVDHTETGEKKHLFTQEKEYYKDLTLSKYGPTSKREGWDCLRHYEYAANGVILCFKNLTNKPPRCAPYDLNTRNTIEYKDAASLLTIVSSLTEEKYRDFLRETYKWITSKTSKKVAIEFLNRVSE
jgi:hypothetical protein